MTPQNKNVLSPSQLMEKIQNSDSSALQTLFERFWEPMYTLAFRLLKQEDLAKDMVQEVWIDLWNRRATVKNQNIAGYLMRATRLRVYKEFRDTKLLLKDTSFFDELPCTDHDDTQESIFSERSIARVEHAIAQLPKKCKHIFILSRYQGLDNEEIANSLGISKRTVETHISNALLRIKNSLALLLFYWLT
jgi:RNA polymerase sigma-70 factor (ECF subfamily)